MESGDHRTARYDQRRDREHHLSILIGQEVVAWVAHDVAEATPVAMAWGADAMILQHPLLPKHPRAVSFVSLPEWSTLVPDGALEPGAVEQHLTLVHGKLPVGQIRDTSVPTLGATCIHVHQAAEETKVLQRFPNARSLPLQAVLLQGAQLRAHAGPAMLIHRGADRVDVALAHGQRVLLSNSYPARTAEDLLYFCLLAAERTALAPADIVLHSGGTHLSDAERALLGRYFPQHRSAVTFNWPGAGAHEHADRWLAAMDQFACVS